MTLKISRSQVSTQPNPTHQKLKKLPQPNPTHGWTQPMTNSAPDLRSLSSWHRYQMGDTGTRMWTTWPGLHSTARWLGFERPINHTHVQHPHHSAIESYYRPTDGRNWYQICVCLSVYHTLILYSAGLTFCIWEVGSFTVAFGLYSVLQFTSAIIWTLTLKLLSPV